MPETSEEDSDTRADRLKIVKQSTRRKHKNINKIRRANTKATAYFATPKEMRSPKELPKLSFCNMLVQGTRKTSESSSRSMDPRPKLTPTQETKPITPSFSKTIERPKKETNSTTLTTEETSRHQDQTLVITLSASDNLVEVYSKIGRAHV